MLIESDLDIKAKIGNDLIYTRWTEEKDHPLIEKEFKSEYRLFINLFVEIEPLARGADVGMISRPRLLTILGILSYMTKKPFMTYQFDQSYRSIIFTTHISENYSENEKFIIRGVNKIEDFKNISRFEYSRNKGDLYIFYSVLDQFRKAIFLQDEDNNNMLYSDEYLIAYFKVLEILVSISSKKQNELLEHRISTFVDEMSESVFFNSDSKLESFKGKMVKDLYKKFINELNISNKIKFFLKENELLTAEIAAFVDELVFFRNSVAHGRTIYKETLAYPLPPFFPSNLKKYFQNYLLKPLIGRVIDKFINTNLYKDDYVEALENTVTSSELVTRYLNEEEYKKFDLQDLQFERIDPYIIAYSLIVGNIGGKHVRKFAMHFIDDILSLDDIPSDLFVIILMTSEFLTDDKREKVVEVLKANIANKSGIFWYYDYFELYKDLQSRGINVKILEEAYIY